MIPEDSNVLVVKGEHLNYFVILEKEYCWVQKSVNLLINPNPYHKFSNFEPPTITTNIIILASICHILVP